MSSVLHRLLTQDSDCCDAGNNDLVQDQRALHAAQQSVSELMYNLGQAHRPSPAQEGLKQCCPALLVSGHVMMLGLLQCPG